METYELKVCQSKAEYNPTKRWKSTDPGKDHGPTAAWQKLMLMRIHRFKGSIICYRKLRMKQGKETIMMM